MKAFPVKIVFILALLSLSPLYSESLWESVVDTFPKEYLLGPVTMDERVLNEEGNLEEHSVYETTINKEGYITVLSMSKGNKEVKSGEAAKMERELNLDDLFIFDPFDPFIQESIDYMLIEKADKSEKYCFSYNDGEVEITGNVEIGYDGIPLYCKYKMHSLPVDTKGYKLQKLDVLNSYTVGKDCVWLLRSVFERAVIEVSYLFMNIPLIVETNYTIKR